jgi:hypothetical protein
MIPPIAMNDPQPEAWQGRIGRRKFLATLGAAAAAWPVYAQQQRCSSWASFPMHHMTPSRAEVSADTGWHWPSCGQSIGEPIEVLCCAA